MSYRSGKSGQKNIKLISNEYTSFSAVTAFGRFFKP